MKKVSLYPDDYPDLDILPGDLVKVLEPISRQTMWNQASAEHSAKRQTVIFDIRGKVGLVLYMHGSGSLADAFMLMDGRLGWHYWPEFLEVVSR